MNYSKEELSNYRLSKAKETFEEAQIMAASKKWNATANRLYYTCFYIVIAYLILDDIESGTHRGIKSKFNKLLISKGKLDRQYGKLYNRLFELRQDADYKDFKDFDEERIAPLVDQVSNFIGLVEQLMNERQI
ncbi:MAG: HEPN domain-containing protein [Bacteroidota bacterium]